MQLTTETLQQVLSTNKPVLILREASFLGLGGNREDLTAMFNSVSTRKLFGRIERFYVHGLLEERVGYDIVDFVAGTFADVPEQAALLVDSEATIHEISIVMVTAIDTAQKYAFAVADDEAEKVKARASLWHGEWLRNGYRHPNGR